MCPQLMANTDFCAVAVAGQSGSKKLAWNLNVEGEGDEVWASGRRNRRHFGAIHGIVEGVALYGDATGGANGRR